MAALVQPATPYAALLGLVHLGLVRRDWASDQAARYASHAALPAELRGDALYHSPTLDGWARVPAGAAPAMPRFDGRAQDYPAEPMLADLLHRARAYFATNAPPGALGAERGVARLCWLLAQFQFAYRNEARAVAELRKLSGDLLLAGPDGSTLVHVHAAITTNKTARSRQLVRPGRAARPADGRLRRGGARRPGRRPRLRPGSRGGAAQSVAACSERPPGCHHHGGRAAR